MRRMSSPRCFTSRRVLRSTALASLTGMRQRAANSSSSKEPTEILHFPNNDLQVTVVPRTASLLAAEFAAAKGYVVSCLRRYTRDYVVVVQNYDQYDGKTVLPKVPGRRYPLGARTNHHQGGDGP